MRTPIRFRAETKYREAEKGKANTNLPIMATVGDHLTGTAAVAGRPGWFHIRLGGETVANPNPTVASRLTQCKAEGVGLVLNDLIFVIKAKDRNLTYYKFHSFIQNTAGTSPYPAGIVIADNVNPAYFIVDDGAVPIEYVRIDTSNAQPIVIFNDGGVDVDFTIEASGVADAFQVRGSDGQITLGALGAGLLESTAGGVISSDYTINSTITMAAGQDIDPANVSGQDLGDVTHRWDLYTQDVIFGGASNANVVTIPTAQAIAFKIVDTAPVEYLRIDTAPQLEVIWNNGEADVDFRVAASGVTNALIVWGSYSGLVGVGGKAGTAENYLSVFGTRAVAPAVAGDGLAIYAAYTGGTTGTVRGAYLAATVADVGAGNYTALTGFAGEVYTGLAINDGAGSAVTAWTGIATTVTGASGVVINISSDTGVILNARGLYGAVYNLGASSRIRVARGLYIGDVQATGADAGQTHNAYGIYIDNLITAAGGGVANNAWAIYSAATEDSWLAGRLSIGGTTVPLAQSHIDQSAAGGNIPVLLLDQADLSEEFIEFTATVGAGNPIDATTALGGYYGMVRVSVTGVGFKWIALYN